MDIIYIILGLLGAFLLRVVFYKLGRGILDKVGLENKFKGRFSFSQISDFSAVLVIILIITIIGIIKNV